MLPLPQIEVKHISTPLHIKKNTHILKEEEQKTGVYKPNSDGNINMKPLPNPVYYVMFIAQLPLVSKSHYNFIWSISLLYLYSF